MPNELERDADRRAAFAQSFKNTTNLDQRRRFAQDISEAKAREEERAQADFERMQLQNPEVGRLVLAREKEERDARNQFAVRDLAERKFQWDQQKAGRMDALNAKRLDLQMRQEDRPRYRALLVVPSRSFTVVVRCPYSGGARTTRYQR